MSGLQVPAHDCLELMTRGSGVCVVVPVINEGDRIVNQLRRMQQVPHGLDIVIADGGSTDGSLEPERLSPLGVRTLLTKTGPGRLSAQLRMGFAYALEQGYDGVITVDGNDKDGVEALPAFTAALTGGADFVQGSRFITGGVAENTPLSRLLAIKLLHAPLISAGARHRFTDTTNGFRGHSAKLLRDPRVAVFRDVFDAYELLAYLPVRAARLGMTVLEIPVRRSYPVGQVPTKINSIAGHADLMAVLVKAAAGRYAPG